MTCTRCNAANPLHHIHDGGEYVRVCTDCLTDAERALPVGPEAAP